MTFSGLSPRRWKRDAPLAKDSGEIVECSVSCRPLSGPFGQNRTTKLKPERSSNALAHSVRNTAAWAASAKLKRQADAAQDDTATVGELC